MLQMFVDETGFDGESPCYVLGGIVSTPDRWTRFSDEWKQVLEMPSPVRVDYLKASEAVSFKGQFFGVSSESRDQKLRNLSRVMHEYALTAVTYILPVELYSRYKSEYPEYLRDVSTYAFMFYQFLRAWMENYEKLGFAGHKMEFIFDENQIDEGWIIEQWNLFMVVERIPARLKKLIYSKPIFRDDKKTLPLQAADLVAFVGRKNYMENYYGEAPFNLFENSKRPPLTFINFETNDESMEGMFRGLRNRTNSLSIRVECPRTYGAHYGWYA